MRLADGPDSMPPFRPIVSSEGTYNYEPILRYLCSLLQPHIPSDYCTPDSFSSREIHDTPISGNFMVSFDVESLFTNKPLDK